MSATNQQASEKTPLTTAHRLLAVPSLMLGAALVLTACGGNEHHVKAVDKVEEAAELARANAPEPQPLELDEVETVAPAAEGGAEVTDATATEATAGATDTEAATEAEATTEEATDAATTAEAEAPVAEEAPAATEEKAAE